MKLVTSSSAEFKNASYLPSQLITTTIRGQMIAPGASSCTLGCSCSCSCGAANTSH